MPDDEIISTEPTTNDEPTTEPVAEDPTPPARTMLDDVKLALRLTTTAYDNELTDLINAALLDMGVAGVVIQELSIEDDQPPTDDPLIKRAVITYCKIHFGSPSDFDRLKRSYDEQKAQMVTATGYTDWGDS